MTGGIMRVVIGVFMAAVAMSAAADQNAIDYRKHTMDAVGGHMQSLVQIAKGQVDHKDHIPVHTASLAALSGIAPDVFPPDSQDGDTDALPKIWKEPDAFKQRLADFKKAANDLDSIVKSGDMKDYGTALGALGKACKSCHDDFKKKD
jgi:cytochrome c556